MSEKNEGLESTGGTPLEPMRPPWSCPGKSPWDKGWVELTLGIHLGAAPGTGFPGRSYGWIYQVFKLPARWSQDEMAWHVANTWSLDSMRPFFYEGADTTAVMWGVRASENAEPGRVHLTLSTKTMEVQPVLAGYHELSGHIVQDSALPVPGTQRVSPSGACDSRACACVHCEPGAGSTKAMNLTPEYGRITDDEEDSTSGFTRGRRHVGNWDLPRAPLE